jgi:hypothetical protein
LDRRIFASADLIRLNKQAAVEKTLQRFSGWVTSLPPTERPKSELRAAYEAAENIGKPIQQLRFQRRRVAIDQGHKLSSNVAAVVAQGSGAIAAVWHDRGQWDKNYDARPDHLARTDKLFIVRDSWAINEGLIRKGSYPYTDSVTQPAEEVYCSCFWEWQTSPRQLPEDALTEKGRAWLKA